jgi:hypothetical protein
VKSVRGRITFEIWDGKAWKMKCRSKELNFQNEKILFAFWDSLNSAMRELVIPPYAKRTRRGVR